MSKIDFNPLNELEVKNDILYRQLFATFASVSKIYAQWVYFLKKIPLQKIDPEIGTLQFSAGSQVTSDGRKKKMIKDSGLLILKKFSNLFSWVESVSIRVGFFTKLFKV